MNNNWNNFTEVILDKTSGNKKIFQSDYLEQGKIPIVDQGKELISGFTNEIESKCKVELPCIIFGDHTKIIKYIDFPFVLGADGVKVLKPINGFDAKYIYFYLKQTKLQGKVSYNRNFKYLKLLKIPHPPLPEQKRIADLLDKADSIRQKRKESIALLDEFLKSVFIEMFGDPVRNEKRWENKRLKELTKIGTGGTPSRKIPNYFTGKIPWVKTSEVKFNYINETEEKITDKAMKNSNCFLYPLNTIMIALYGQGLTRGRSAILKIEATTNQACAAILPSENFDSYFMWYQLIFFYNHLRNISRGGNQPNLNLNFIKELKIILPPINLQTQFTKIVEHVEVTKSKMEESLREMDNQFNALLQRAFRK